MENNAMAMLYLVGGMCLYCLIGFVIDKIYVCINFVKYLLLAVVARMPMDFYKVSDTDAGITDYDTMILSRIFWPIGFVWYIGWVVSTFFVEFAKYANSNGSRTPKWLTLRGWVNYTNQILGLKNN